MYSIPSIKLHEATPVYQNREIVHDSFASTVCPIAMSPEIRHRNLQEECRQKLDDWLLACARHADHVFEYTHVHVNICVSLSRSIYIYVCMYVSCVCMYTCTHKNVKLLLGMPCQQLGACQFPFWSQPGRAMEASAGTPGNQMKPALIMLLQDCSLCNAPQPHVWLYFSQRPHDWHTGLSSPECAEFSFWFVVHQGSLLRSSIPSCGGIYRPTNKAREKQPTVNHFLRGTIVFPWFFRIYMLAYPAPG